MEEGIDETVSSLDEKDDEESEEQVKEDRIDHPCPPSNESNSSTHAQFNSPPCLPKDACYDDCYDPVDYFEISLFDDACYACGQDANINDAYGDELAIVPYVKNKIVAIAPAHDSPIIFLNSPYYTISEKFALIKDYIDGLLLPLHMMILIDIISMCLLLLLAIIMREELHLHLFMFPT